MRTTSNLHAALQRLRLFDSHHLVWADAVCINQADIEERSTQIRLMRSIYSRAHETVDFLGEAGEEAMLAIELGQKILDLAYSLPKAGQDTTTFGPLTTIVKITPDNYESYRLPPSQGKEWIALRMLFTVPWFRRVWIIQEFALSRYVSFRWGDILFTFEYLVRLSHLLRGQV